MKVFPLTVLLYTVFSMFKYIFGIDNVLPRFGMIIISYMVASSGMFLVAIVFLY